MGLDWSWKPDPSTGDDAASVYDDVNLITMMLVINQEDDSECDFYDNEKDDT